MLRVTRASFIVPQIRFYWFCELTSRHLENSVILPRLKYGDLREMQGIQERRG